MADSLHEQLLRMAGHIRDPQANPPPPGIEARRLAVYRQLFFGNLQALLAGSFPVLHASLAAEHWHRLCEDFYANHRCHTPLFTEVGSEWVEYLQGRGEQPGWIAELAHYEWIETALLLSDAAEPEHAPEGDLLAGVPVLSSLAEPLAYAWPVSHIGPEHLPGEAPDEPTLLLAHRGKDHKVAFSRLAPLAHALLQSLQDQPVSGREHLAALAAAAGVEPAAIAAPGLALLQSLKAQGVVLGTR
ncbi:putative DNA-binding domain-containing protein [Pseudomonas sp.]|uniref:HvfC family RiPP maturation protein n=1 Tax=Pseudomonas sp. TaxID=306 RepID=UPI0028A95B3F|nr:putative DNA-binding domain-containing protein [Pseudomonas sp.]